MGVVNFYLKEDPDSPIEVSFDPDAPNEDRVAVLGIAAVMLMLALNADEQASFTRGMRCRCASQR